MAKFKKMDRVRIRIHENQYFGEVGTVVLVAPWVFAPEEMCYAVALDSVGYEVICDDQDLEEEK